MPSAWPQLLENLVRNIFVPPRQPLDPYPRLSKIVFFGNTLEIRTRVRGRSEQEAGFMIGIHIFFVLLGL